MSSPSLLLSPPLEPSRAPTSSSTWFPYGEGTAFHGRFATIIIVVLCLLVVALSILTIVHTFRSRAVGAPRRPPSSPSKQVPSLPALDFPVGVRLVGTELECAICLSEFVSGEKVAVLPRCNHGFHVSCIERWFASCSTCPTCRTTFYSPPPPPEKNLSSPQPELPV